MVSTLSQDPTPEAIADFWDAARQTVGFTQIEFIIGQQQSSALEPPWMHLSPDAEEATTLLKALIAARIGEIRIPASEYAEAEVHAPIPGELAIACMGDGSPAALVQTAGVERSDGPDGRIITEKLRVLYPRKRS